MYKKLIQWDFLAAQNANDIDKQFTHQIAFNIVFIIDIINYDFISKAFPYTNPTYTAIRGHDDISTEGKTGFRLSYNGSFTIGSFQYFSLGI